MGECIACKDIARKARRHRKHCSTRTRIHVGWRVVRTNPDTGNREYLATLAQPEGDIWSQRRSFLYRSEQAARDDAQLRGGRVCKVFATKRGK